MYCTIHSTFKNNLVFNNILDRYLNTHKFLSEFEDGPEPRSSDIILVYFQTSRDLIPTTYENYVLVGLPLISSSLTCTGSKRPLRPNRSIVGNSGKLTNVCQRER